MARTTDWLIVLLQPRYCRYTRQHGSLRLHIWGAYRSEAEAMRALTHSVLQIFNHERKAYYVHRTVYEKLRPFYQRKDGPC